MRALTLHISALNDGEYDSYTEALNDLTADRNQIPTSDDRYDKVSVGVREVRAWLRGRYATVPAEDIDAILKFFSPNLNSKDMLNGGQFFAVMRLVMHAKDGKGIDKGFAFVQAYPEATTSDTRPSSKAPANARPSIAMTSAEPSVDNNPFHAVSLVAGSHAPTFVHPQKPPTHPDMNPPSFSTTASATPKSTNPFLSRTKSDARPNGNNDNSLPKLPPLPPRKPPSLLASIQPPTTPSPRPSLSPGYNPLSKNPKPTHVVSPLMRQSLEASRAAYTLRKAEENLERERVLQVLKSSSGNGSSSSLRNTSPSPPKMTSPSTSVSDSSSAERDAYGHPPLTNLPNLPPRPKRAIHPRPPSSIADSVLSYEQVAKASLSIQPSVRSAPSSVFSSRSPERGRLALTPENDEPRASSSSPSRPTNITPPPMHPDRKHLSTSAKEHKETPFSHPPLSPLSSTPPKFSRSKSLHHAKPPPPPPARSARTRPGSVQISPVSTTSTLPSVTSTATPGTAESPVLKRRFSLSSNHSRGSSIDSAPSVKNLKKTLSSLQPKLDAARYKAEAGLSKRGYVNHTSPGPGTSPAFKKWADEGEERLIDADDDDVTVDGSSMSFDDDGDSLPGHYDRPRHGKSVLERDEMKLPTGDGWGLL